MIYQDYLKEAKKTAELETQLDELEKHLT